MAFELAPAIIGLSGVLLGGAVTLGANLLTTRSQIKLATSSRSQGVRDRQFAVHLAYLVAADHVLGECRLFLKKASETGTISTPTTEELQRISDMWSRLLEPRAGAQMAGPTDILDKMTAFHVPLAALHDFVESGGKTLKSRIGVRRPTLVGM